MKDLVKVLYFSVFGPKNVPFQPILNTCRQVQFQKNLMNRSRENFKSADCRPKSDPFTPFEHNTNFP